MQHPEGNRLSLRARPRVEPRAALARAPGHQPLQPPSAPSHRGRRAATGRVGAARRALVDAGALPDLVERLCLFVEQDDDPSVGRIRPYALADLWQAERRAVLELCLEATRHGLL